MIGTTNKSTRTYPISDTRNPINTTLSSNVLYNTGSIHDFGKIVEYLDFIVNQIGVDLDYERFSSMTKNEITSLSRDLKIKKLTE